MPHSEIPLRHRPGRSQEQNGTILREIRVTTWPDDRNNLQTQAAALPHEAGLEDLAGCRTSVYGKSPR